MDNCRKAIVHIGPHLVETHGVVFQSTEYYQLLRSAKKFDGDAMPKKILTSPTKSSLPVKSKFRSAVKSLKSKENMLVSNDDFTPKHSLAFLSEEKPQAKSIIDNVQSDYCDSDNSESSENDDDGDNSESDVSENDKRNSDGACSDDKDGNLNEAEMQENKLSSASQEILRSFYHHMIGPDRGRKPKSVAGVIADIKRIVLAVGAGKIANIFDKNTDTLRKLYLEGYCKKYGIKPSAIRKYLYSLIDFIKYLMKSDIEIEGLEIKNLKVAKGNIKLWRKNYSRRAKKDTMKSRQDDYKMLVTADQVSSYLHSEDSKRAASIVQRLETDENYGLSMTNYCCIRDHLYIMILLSTACRSGVPAKMKVGKALDAIFSDGMYTIEVDDHKTDYAYGSASIVLDKNEYRMLLTFINKARSQLKTTSNYVFLSYYGKPIEGGDVSKRLFRRWSQAGIFEGKTIPKNLTVNILRKSASTGIRENNPEKVQQTCDTMCHSAHTAAEHYWPRQKELSVSSGSQAIRNYFTVS